MSGPVFAAQARADTLRWLERAVIGLGLCPFAKAVHAKGQVHLAVYLETAPDGLINALLSQAEALVACEPAVRDTTLLVAPSALPEFIEFIDFTRRAERHLSRAGFEGVLQLASFHPRFEFADSAGDDVANATNRSPYPTLHLLREASVSRAVAAFPQAETIFKRNMETLRALGTQGWAALRVGPGDEMLP